MEFTIDARKFGEALGLLRKVVGTCSITPITTACKISVSSDNAVTVTATNMEQTIIAKAKADEVLQEGQVVVPYSKISAMIKDISGPVSLKRDKETLFLNYGITGHVKLRCFADEDFPQEKNQKGKGVVINIGEKFIDMLTFVSFATARDIARPIFSAVAIDCRDGKVFLVATDGHRLAFAQEVAETEHKGMALLPQHLVDDIVKINPETMTVYENKIAFEGSKGVFKSSLIDGEYVNYKQVIPKESPATITVNKDKIEPVIKRAANMAEGSKTGAVKMVIDNDRVSFVAESEEGVFSESVSEIKVSGDLEKKPLELAFNAKYLKDMFHFFPNEEMEIGIMGALKPMVARGASFTSLTLPIRLAS